MMNKQRKMYKINCFLKLSEEKNIILIDLLQKINQKYKQKSMKALVQILMPQNWLFLQCHSGSKIKFMQIIIGGLKLNHNKFTQVPNYNDLKLLFFLFQICCFNLYLYFIVKMISKFLSIEIGILVLIALSLLLNYFFRNQLFVLGNEIIYDLLQRNANIFFNVFFNCLTMIADPIMIIVYFAALMTYKHKIRAYFTIIFFLFNLYLITLLKAIYADPRPFWSQQRIQSLSLMCPRQFGNPSGHSWITPIIVFTFIQYFGNGRYYSFIIFGTFICIGVPISRMYLGAHSLNQIVQGILMGLSLVCLYVLKIKKQMIFMIKQVYEKLTQNPIIYISPILYLLSVGSFIYVSLFKVQIPQQWLDNIKKDCFSIQTDKATKDAITENLNYLMLLASSSLVTILTVMIICLRLLIKDQMILSYLQGNWQLNAETGQTLKLILKYFAIEVLTLLVGCLIIIPAFFFVTYKLVSFLLINVGIAVATYCYLYYAPKYHFHYGIIRSTSSIV